MKLLNTDSKKLQKISLALGIAFALGSSGAMAAPMNQPDADNNGKISKAEYYGYVDDIGIYDDWDLDNDNLLEEDEWHDLDYDYNFTSWDIDNDGYLDDNEFLDGTFDYYDIDDDNFLNDEEWDDAGEAGWFDV
ncbi:hypothetical protein [Idiomarina sp. HP20-50]|uniref:hypothetical protein n=1 Tax=Idiomarina sp. HP20-50 TaxID=3070813 RepID=UPI00294ACC08|nr:hypothetical protein [Idiomarina sp. HP20-50]MDV6315624.1 hypothetical protein [Idiomarina sp. HP20-50]